MKRTSSLRWPWSWRLGCSRRLRVRRTTALENAFWTWLSRGQDPRLFWSAGVGLGIGTGVAAYLMTKKHGNPGVRHVSASAPPMA